jgi:hypothetical protein
MEIEVALQNRLETNLTEGAIAGIRAIRELPQLAIERERGARAPPHEERSNSCARPAPARPMRNGSTPRCASGSPPSVPRHSPAGPEAAATDPPTARANGTGTIRTGMLEDSIAVPKYIAARCKSLLQFPDRAPGPFQGRGLCVRRGISELR